MGAISNALFAILFFPFLILHLLVQVETLHQHATEATSFSLLSPLSCIPHTSCDTSLSVLLAPRSARLLLTLPATCLSFSLSLLPNLACQRNDERQEDGSCII